MLCQRKYRKYGQLIGTKSIKGSLSKIGSKNPMFGKIKEDVKNCALHHWVRKYIKMEKKCHLCGEKNKKLDLSNRTYIYDRDFNNWWFLCRRCHLNYDGNIKYLELGRKGNNFKYKYETV